jgi:prepilin-type processing-associated H-X9-DG protein
MLKLKNAKSQIRIEHVDLEQKLQRLFLKLKEEAAAGNSLLAHGDYLNFLFCDNIITARTYFVKNQLSMTKLWYRSLINFSSGFLDLFLQSKKADPCLTDSDVFPNFQG